MEGPWETINIDTYDGRYLPSFIVQQNDSIVFGYKNLNRQRKHKDGRNYSPAFVWPDFA